MTKKRIYLNAFDMNCVGHQSPGLWTHPEDQAHRYKDLDYWTDLAQILEGGQFDALFLADVLGTYDVYQNSREGAVRQAAQVPVNDPLLVVPAMAQVTKHLGFGVTASVTYEHPYSFARRVSTLDHLTKGRVGWNIVTSYLESAARNLGLDTQIKHDERYNIAEEYVEVCYKLWEGSWEDDAVVRDTERKVYTDPDKVHDIHHNGTYYQVPGAHLSEPSPQRTPVLFQAGSSPKGRAFAAKHAECVFISTPTVTVTKRYVDKLREETKRQGRNPEEVKVMSLFTPIVAETEEAAQQKLKEYRSYASYEGGLVLLGGWTGIDFSDYDPEEELRFVENEAIHSAVETFTKIDPNKKWTVREVAEFVGIGGIGPVVAGTPEQVADAMEEWVDQTGVDGFNIAYAVTPGTFKDLADYVVPILQKRGRIREKYEGDTLRENLSGNSRLPDRHPARQAGKAVQQSRKQTV